MDPISPLAIASGIAGLIGVSKSLVRGLYELNDGTASASREFDVFKVELHTFRLLWDFVRPKLEDPDSVLSHAALETLEEILLETQKTLTDLEDSLDEFTAKQKRKLFSCMSQDGLQKFMRRDRTRLSRSQIHHATTKLDILVAVVKRASPDHHEHARSAASQSEDILFRRERKARRAREDLRHERGRSVQAETGRWLPDAPHTRGQSRIAELVPIWTRPVSRTSTTRSHGGSISQQHLEECIRSHTEPLQQRIEQMGQRQAHKDQIMAKLERDLDQLQGKSDRLKADFEQALQREKGLHHAEVAQLKQQFQAVLRNLEIQNARCSELQNECAELHLQQDEREERIRTLETEKAGLERQVSNMQRSYNNLQNNAAVNLRRHAPLQRETQPASSYQRSSSRQQDSSRGSSRHHRSSSGHAYDTSYLTEDEPSERRPPRASSGSGDARDRSKGSARRCRTYTVSNEQPAREDPCERRTSSHERRQEHQPDRENSRGSFLFGPGRRR